MRPTMPVSPTRVLTSLAVAAALAALTACSSAPADEPASEEAAADTADTAGDGGAEGVEIATVLGDGVDVHAEPGGEEVLHTLASPNDFGVERAFLVERNEGEWLQVLLPVRPNGSTGWVRSEEVSLTSTGYRVEVDTGDFAFTVFDGDEQVRTGVIGTGEGETPTPEGRYYFTELLQPPDPEGPTGLRLRPERVLRDVGDVRGRARPARRARHQRRGRPGPPGQPRVRPGLQRGHHLDGREPADRHPGRDLRVSRPAPDRRAGRYPAHTNHTRGLPCV